MEELLVVEAPGRINIIGDHTDYNQGYVLPASIQLKTTFTFAAAKVGHTITAASTEELYNYKESSELTEEGWKKYLQAATIVLKRKGFVSKPYLASFKGNVPIGSGLSSSASLVCSFMFGLKTFNNWHISKLDMAKFAQETEHLIGVNCGLMDQFISIYGVANHCFLLDCSDFSFQEITFDLKGNTIFLINSNVSHSLAASAYNDRRATCEAYFPIVLNELQLSNNNELQVAHLPDIERLLPAEAFKRLRHVVTENDRVLNAVRCLKSNDYNTLGKILNESHASLKSDYEVSCPEIDFLVAASQSVKSIKGARMMGGGFGGCVLVLSSADERLAEIEMLLERYKATFGLEATVIPIQIDNGASLVRK